MSSVTPEGTRMPDHDHETDEHLIATVQRLYRQVDDLQAEVRRLTRERDEARADFFAVCDRLGTVHEPDMGPRHPGTLADVLHAIEAVERERDEARALLAECADELAAYVEGQYHPDGGVLHPAVRHRYERDMDIVNRARAALPTPPEETDRAE